MFQISAHGSREGVLRALQATQAQPENSQPAKAQLETVKALLEAEIAALPTEFNGVRVEAQGDCAGARNIQITVIPLKLHL